MMSASSLSLRVPPAGRRGACTSIAICWPVLTPSPPTWCGPIKTTFLPAARPSRSRSAWAHSSSFRCGLAPRSRSWSRPDRSNWRQAFVAIGPPCARPRRPVPGHAQARRRRPVVIAPLRIGRRDIAPVHLGGVARPHWAGDHRRPGLNRDAAHLCRRVRRRHPSRRDGTGVPGYEAVVLGPDGAAPAGRGRAAGGTRPHRVQVSQRRPPADVCPGRLEHHRDAYLRDEDGYFWYQARIDDMIISSGYNIAGPEVEAALLTHPMWPRPASSARPTLTAAPSSRPSSSSAPVSSHRRPPPGCSSARQGDHRPVQVPA